VSTILVTGATDGLGRALAHELVARGHEIVVHGRSRERAEAVASEIGGAPVQVADFARLDDVRALAERVEGIDVLVNNAGIIAAERRLSEDGIELTFQVNHLAGFLLTLLMLPPRTVNVASVGQRAPDFDDLMLERGYEGYRAYAQSKLAQIMSGFELATRIPAAELTVNSLHPATYMPTKMVLEEVGRHVDSIEDGVAATSRLVSDPALAGTTGAFFDRTREARAHAQAYDPEARAELWRRATELVAPEDPTVRVPSQ
jgi:NAD(P)-dependent dehydrogenase (short-subunit alcohol dehydrogenase family)